MTLASWSVILLTTGRIVHAISVGYDRAVQESPYEREGIDNRYFRVLTGLVGLVALLPIGVQLLMLLPAILEQGVQILNPNTFCPVYWRK